MVRIETLEKFLTITMGYLSQTGWDAVVGLEQTGWDAVVGLEQTGWDAAGGLEDPAPRAEVGGGKSDAIFTRDSSRWKNSSISR